MARRLDGQKTRFPKNIDREFNRNYVSPPWTCNCAHAYPVRFLCEVATPILTKAVICWGCGTVLGYEDSTSTNPLELLEHMVTKRKFVVRKGIATAPTNHGLARQTSPIVLYEMIKLGMAAGLSAKDISSELGVDEKYVRRLGG